MTTSADAERTHAPERTKAKMVVAFIGRPEDISQENWDGEIFQLFRCENPIHMEGGNPWNPTIPHGLVKESDLA